MRRALELDRDLGHPLGQPLAGADVERRARPPPVVDLELARRCRWRALESAGTLRLLAVAGHQRRRPHSRAAYWPRTRGLERHRLGWPAAPSPSRRAPTRPRRPPAAPSPPAPAPAAGGSGPCRARRRSPRRTPPGARRRALGDGDLHVVDVAVVPDRLEDRVGEPEHEDVLHRLLAQVMVDAEDLALAERAVDGLGQLAGPSARSWPNGFSITTRTWPSRPVQLGRPQPAHDHGEEAGRRRQVEHPVRAAAHVARRGPASVPASSWKCLASSKPPAW